MQKIICYEVYYKDGTPISKYKSLINTHGFEEKENTYGTYYYIEVYKEHEWQIRLLLRSLRLKFKRYDKKYARSSGYRREYLKRHGEKHRCAYCGKKISTQQMEVDHLIPVAKAKYHLSVQILVHLLGYKTINDPRNLVASCKDCNKKKSDKMGLWYIKGLFGKHAWFWKIRTLLIMILLSILLYFAIQYGFIF